MTMDSDWDFIVALATMAVVVASVVLIYMAVTHVRTRVAERRMLTQSQIANAERLAVRPVYFRRYTGEPEDAAEEAVDAAPRE